MRALSPTLALYSTALRAGGEAEPGPRHLAVRRVQDDVLRRQAAHGGEFGGDGLADRAARGLAFRLVLDADDDHAPVIAGARICN